MKEKDLAQKIVEKYQKEGYEIYSEVIYKPGSKRADIIAVKNDEYINIETKMSLNLTLLEQSFYWKDKVNKSYICFPSKRKMNWFGLKMCKDLGIGVYVYRKNKIELLYESTICEHPDLPKLYEQQKDSIAGSKGGGYVTPFSMTKNKLIEYVIKNGECSLISAVKNIEHHYSSDNSAKQSLHKMININVIPELEIFRKGNSVCVKSV